MAAESGNTDCIKVLLSFFAPSCPRNKRREIPALLAKQQGHMDAFTLLVNHHSPVPQLLLTCYYHGKIDRHAAQERLLSEPDASSGHFLLRQSTRKQAGYVLTLLYEAQAYNYEISEEHDLLHIDDGPIFASVECLVDHYIRFMDGLPCCLIKPVPPSHPLAERDLPNQFPHINQSYLDRLHQDDSGALSDEIGSSTEQCPLLSFPSHENPKTFSTNSFDNRRMQKPNIVVTKSTSRPSTDLINLHGSPATYQKSSQSSSSPFQSNVPSRDNLKLDLKSLSISNTTMDNSATSGSSPTMDGNRTDEIFGEIDINRLSVGQLLGHGEFGSVLRGIWLSPSGDQIDVAVKTLHDNDKVNKKSFLKEAEVMMNLNHLYIVKLVGVCHGPPVAMVQELMSMGSLLDFLLEHPDQVSVDFHLKLWAAQIAEGMLYLEQKHFVHRDLAARNILLSSLTLVKISDFGLTRALGVNKDYYVASEGGKWPLKWYAPEAINYGTFTHSSDVWSYAITLWEMYTFGDQPYGDLAGHKVVELLDKDERLPQPEKCPNGVFEIMLRCWSYKAQQRPAFRELAAIFRTKPEYINIKPYFK